ncbi:MAG: integrase arm-type DNA-binding domain-containing protein [Geminicoccaceae bacterium]
MALTDRFVKTAPPGRHSDGRGLTLLVQASGRRSWVLRVQHDGKRRDFGLGAYPDVSLANAREKARAMRKAIKEGRDPDAKPERKLTFLEAAERLIASKQPERRNSKHAAQWPSTLKTYVYPIIGEKEIRAISTEHVLAILQPIWTTKTETATRVRQRIEAVLNYAYTLLGIDAANPARWRGHLENILPKPNKVRSVKHHAALSWPELPEFMQALQEREGVAAKALAFAILTAARTGEVLGMRWREIDLANATWTVPANRYKTGIAHRVPLSSAALALLGEPCDGNALVFPSPRKSGRPMSDMTLSAVLRRMKRDDITVHGFRSTFRVWVGEATDFPREAGELALGHVLSNKVEAAYARTDLFEKRRQLMEEWAGYACGAANPANAVNDLHNSSTGTRRRARKAA